MRRFHRPLPWAQAFLRFFRDPDASLLGKAFVVAAAMYVVMPLDAIPDVIPVIGWLDDLGLATMAMLYLSRVLQKYRVEPALARA
jgi:uncharacterized membrane protein YkvA (DUF1232 family)